MQFFFIVSFFINSINAQGVSDWDNQLYISNKVASSSGSWRYSGELQIRLMDNTQSLEQWYLEAVVTYQLNKHWEVVPDLRYTIKPTKNEVRPGIGIVYKHYVKDKVQFVHQAKYQMDISTDEARQGLRYAVFVNYLIHKKFIPYAAFGVFYRWQNDFTGVQFYRTGLGLAYLIDVKHSLNFSYFLGFKDTGETWIAQGIPVFQLIININPDYKYVPAKYINF